MGKVEKQQKKLEAMREKEERKRLKAEEKLAKKEARRMKRRGKVPKVNLRADRAEVSDEGVEFKPKNTSWKKAVAIILWLIIAFFVVQGVVSVLNRESSEDLKKTMNNHYDTLSSMEASQMEAGTFTSSFLREYYTYDNQNDTWNERTYKYVATGVILDEPSGIDKEDLIASEIRRITVDKDAIDVDAYVEVAYKTSESDGENKTEKDGTLKHMIRVPLAKNGDNYAVVSAPIYIADTNMAAQVEYDGTHLNGNYVSGDALKSIETTAGNFLKAYYGKKPSELKYYVTKDFGILSTVGGTMSFEEINECQAVRAQGGYTVMVKAIINNGFSDVTETIYLDMVKGEEGRLYVNKIKTRQ